MTRKFDEAREQAFIAALGESGNLTLSAERTGVSRSWVRLRRQGSGRFDQQVRQTLRLAAEELPRRAVVAGTPPLAWREHEGVALTVRGVGDTGAASRARRVQLGRARARQWTAAVEARFLEALGATCNVKAAAKAAGRCHSSAYAHRQRWPAFAAAWDAALKRATARLEAALLAGWCDPAGGAPVAERPIEPMSAEQALELLKLHRAREAGRLGRREHDPAHLRALLARRIAQVRAASRE